MTTYSQGLRLSEPTPGDPAVANIWGTILNTNFTLIDTSITGTLVLDVSGGANIVLTANNGNPDQSRNANFVFPGTLTGNINVLFPEGGAGSFSVQNTTTGAFSLSVAVNNGSGAPEGLAVIVPQGGTLDLVSNGTDVRKRIDLIGLGGAASGANSDITSLTGLTTPLPITEGGTGATSGAAALAALGYVPAELRSQTFTSSGVFTVPASATASTIFKFTVVGGGGGGGANTAPSASGQGGGSGGAIVASFSGFTEGTDVTVNIGSGAAGGSGASGGTGSATTVVYDASTIITANGGVGGSVNSGIAFSGNGAVGSVSAASGGGVTLVNSFLGGAQPGIAGWGASNGGGGFGGGNSVGSGGLQGTETSPNGSAGNFGGGGGGGSGSSSGNGGSGGNGVVIVEWVL